MTSTLPGSRIGSEATAPARGQHNPLLQPWRGPHGGVPPFDTMRIEHLRPALEAGMAEQLDYIPMPEAVKVAVRKKWAEVH